MKLSINHETKYVYTTDVETAQHTTCLKPLELSVQHLLSHQLQIVPEPMHIAHTTDVYSNHRSFFSLQVPHDELKVISSSVVKTSSLDLPPSTIAWETVRDLFDYHSNAEFLNATEFTFASNHAKAHSEFLSYAKPSFAAGRSLMEASIELMQRMHQDFKYESNSTEIETPALEALAQKKGVCQDFAHIMIACLRSLGLSARYTSGYLLTHPASGQQKLIGSDASHAWISVFLPDAKDTSIQGWFDLDPTNNRSGWGSPGEDYITVATGRDFSDVSPVRGVINGGDKHTLQVAVTVTPLD